MKILVLTESLDVKSGWGRYSNDLLYGLEKNGIKYEIILHKKNEKNLGEVLLPNPLSWKKNYFFCLYYALKIYLKIKNKKFDVIHSHIETYSPIAMILSLLSGKKFYVTLHGTYAVKPYSINIFIRFLQYFSYLKASQLIAVSEYTKEKTIKYFPKILDKVVVIHNGIKISTTKNITNINNKKLILTVAPLKERKGVVNVAKAMVKMLKKYKEVSWAVVGSLQDKQYAENLISIIKHENLIDRCFFYSNIPDDELLKIYSKSFLFVLTPQSTEFEFEGFGLVYLEANSFGLPTIGAYNCGAESAVNEGVGYLVNFGDINTLFNKISTLIEDKKLYENKSKMALNWAKKHSIELVSKKYCKLITSNL